MSPAGMRRLVEARAVLDAACLMLRAVEVIVLSPGSVFMGNEAVRLRLWFLPERRSLCQF